MKTLTKTTLIALVAIVMTGAGNVQASEVTGTISSDGGGSGATVVSAPVASPTGDSYTSTQSVTLTAINAEIHYTINNSEELTCTTGTIYTAGSPISVAVSQLIRALSCYSTGASSDIAEFAYAITKESSDDSSSGTTSSGGGGGGGGGGIITTPETESYDFNSDGQIDIFDFNILITNWGAIGVSKDKGDANGDGDVDIYDFNLLIINWQS